MAQNNVMPAEVLYEISLSNHSSRREIAELFKRIFLQLKCDPASIIELQKPHQTRVCVFFANRNKAQNLKKRIDALGLKRCRLSLRTLYQGDWRDKWKKDFNVLALTPDVAVVPVWKKKNYRGRRTPIFLDTVNAFGTGQHETTLFAAQLIEKSRGRFKSFFDIGTGTGILSIVAHKYGANYICGVDIDRTCLRIAKENMRVNGCRFHSLTATDIKKFPKQRAFDLVAANLNSFELIRLRDKIVSYVKPDRFLIISGISRENFRRCHRAYKEISLKCLNIKKGKKWIAIRYQRIK